MHRRARPKRGLCGPFEQEELPRHQWVCHLIDRDQQRLGKQQHLGLLLDRLALHQQQQVQQLVHLGSGQGLQLQSSNGGRGFRPVKHRIQE